MNLFGKEDMNARRQRAARATPFQGLYPRQSLFLAKTQEGGVPLRLGMRWNALKAIKAICGAPPVPAENKRRRMDRINESGP